MQTIKVKPDFASYEVGFLGKFAPLGERTQEDLRHYVKDLKSHRLIAELDMFEFGDEGEGDAPSGDEKPRAVETDTKAERAAAKAAREAAKQLANQTPETPEEAALNAIHGASGPTAPATTSATDNTAITPAV